MTRTTTSCRTSGWTSCSTMWPPWRSTTATQDPMTTGLPPQTARGSWRLWTLPPTRCSSTSIWTLLPSRRTPGSSPCSRAAEARRPTPSSLQATTTTTTRLRSCSRPQDRAQMSASRPPSQRRQSEPASAPHGAPAPKLWSPQDARTTTT
eukprot:Amastigsp_a677898_55.p6 type:complete len:150 gc:universal Amastigsp_a677898_55:1516-1965(+)